MASHNWLLPIFLPPLLTLLGWVGNKMTSKVVCNFNGLMFYYLFWPVLSSFPGCASCECVVMSVKPPVYRGESWFSHSRTPDGMCPPSSIVFSMSHTATCWYWEQRFWPSGIVYHTTIVFCNLCYYIIYLNCPIFSWR